MFRASLVLILPSAIASFAAAQPVIRWSTIDAGGVQNVHAGAITLSATIGQFDASPSVAAANVTLTSGYWSPRVSACLADFNGDNFLDFFDYDDYVNCFENAVCPPNRTADFNGDAFVDFFDYDDFVTAFEVGC